MGYSYAHYDITCNDFAKNGKLRGRDNGRQRSRAENREEKVGTRIVFIQLGMCVCFFLQRLILRSGVLIYVGLNMYTVESRARASASARVSKV